MSFILQETEIILLRPQILGFLIKNWSSDFMVSLYNNLI